MLLAVHNRLFARFYDNDPQDVASLVFAFTVLSTSMTPTVLVSDAV